MHTNNNDPNNDIFELASELLNKHDTEGCLDPSNCYICQARIALQDIFDHIDETFDFLNELKG